MQAGSPGYTSNTWMDWCYTMISRLKTWPHNVRLGSGRLGWLGVSNIWQRLYTLKPTLAPLKSGGCETILGEGPFFLGGAREFLDPSTKAEIAATTSFSRKHWNIVGYDMMKISCRLVDVFSWPTRGALFAWLKRVVFKSPECQCGGGFWDVWCAEDGAPFFTFLCGMCWNHQWTIGVPSPFP